MAYSDIADATLAFGEPVSHQTMRVLRDNITKVSLGNQMTANVSRIGLVNNISYCEEEVNLNVSNGTVLGARIVSATGNPGTLLSADIIANNNGGVTIKAVVQGSSTATIIFRPIVGEFGGLVT